MEALEMYLEKLGPVNEVFKSLPFYPYNVIAVGVILVLLILIVVSLMTSSKKKQTPRRRGAARGKGGPVRGLAMDGMTPFGEFDPQLYSQGGVPQAQQPQAQQQQAQQPQAQRPQAQQQVPQQQPNKTNIVDPALIAKAVQLCQNAFQEMYIEMYIGLGLMSDFESTRTEVLRRIGEGQETYHALTDMKMKPDGVVMMQLASVAGNILLSGKQHIGKGLLGIHGQELLTVYNYALNALQEKGYSTPEETQSKLAFMEHKIKELG